MVDITRFPTTWKSISKPGYFSGVCSSRRASASFSGDIPAAGTKVSPSSGIVPSGQDVSSSLCFCVSIESDIKIFIDNIYALYIIFLGVKLELLDSI